MMKVKSQEDELLVFSVTPFKIDQNKSQNRSIDKAQSLSRKRKVNMKRLLPRFRSQQFFLCKICREMFYPNLEIFEWRRHAGAHPDRHNRTCGDRKPTETSIAEFCYNSVNLSLKELKNIKKKFSNMNCSDSQISQKVTCLTNTFNLALSAVM